ncbi:bifunctional diaminohydroxyphosphoribosylaminopyrimidine deaminase/5-amino-6-(5-phosphoribosylamino)uracil reductase RibD [Altererythrobacter sp. CAU 1778]
MPTTEHQLRWLDAAARLAERARPISRPNPGVGAVIVKDDRVVGRGWTQEGGRPHAEAIALQQAGAAARGATVYVTLEPCAHASPRGPSCADLLCEAKPARVLIGCVDPDPRTAGQGAARLRGAKIAVEMVDHAPSRASLAGYLMQRQHGRPHVTLKIAMSLDGRIALASGESRWITGPQARAHTHRERARADAILVGGGTWRADRPALDVRLPGLETRSPARILLSRGIPPDGVKVINDPHAIAKLEGVQYLFVEGGGGAAASFLEAGLVDRLLIYRAPILLGGDGIAAIGPLGIDAMSEAHGRWRLRNTHVLGNDTLEVYDRA